MKIKNWRRTNSCEYDTNEEKSDEFKKKKAIMIRINQIINNSLCSYPLLAVQVMVGNIRPWSNKISEKRTWDSIEDAMYE